jgi:HAD superfamily hydrolase (TIGR01549 family)
VIEAVIFDFDGVLVESVDIKTRAFAKLFEHEGPEAVKAIVSYHLANGGVSRFVKFRHIYDNVLKRPLSDAEFDRLCRDFKDLVVRSVVEASEVEGASECLSRLYGKARMFIVSGTPQEEVRAIVKSRGIGHYFDGVYGSPETKTNLVNIILNEYGLTPKNVVFVGDAITDYEAAMEAGTGFVARKTPESEDLWASLKVKAVEKLSDCMQEIDC